MGSGSHCDPRRERGAGKCRSIAASPSGRNYTAFSPSASAPCPGRYPRRERFWTSCTAHRRAGALGAPCRCRNLNCIAGNCVSATGALCTDAPWAVSYSQSVNLLLKKKATNVVGVVDVEGNFRGIIKRTYLSLWMDFQLPFTQLGFLCALGLCLWKGQASFTSSGSVSSARRKISIRVSDRKERGSFVPQARGQL